MTTGPGPLRVLFLCTGNSARSIFAEAFLRQLGAGRFEAYSAGSHPSGVVNPMTLRVLRERFHVDASDARSKSWDELQGIRFDVVITVCDGARESCPIWPGQPVVGHWGVEDPAAFVGSEVARERVFHEVALTLRRRVERFTLLPIGQVDRRKLGELVQEVGRAPASDGEAPAA